MKTLTISQPYAELIRSGEKFVENRRWYTAHRGQLAIHAGRGLQYLTKEQLAKYTVGAIVATCELVACLRLEDLRNEPDKDIEIEGTRFTIGQLLNHQYTEGPYLWVLDNVQSIEPVYISGMQGLWSWEGRAKVVSQ